MSEHKASPLGGRLVSWPVVLLAPFILLCGMFILKRLIFGIGSVADLNGDIPGDLDRLRPADRHRLCLWRLGVGLGGVCV